MTFLDRLLGRGSGDVLEQQEETRLIVRMLQDGLTPEDVEHELVDRGVPFRQAHRRVKMVLKVRRRGVHLFDQPSSPGTGE
jgi:argininosuccinate lyase